jgi:hypothetical protein
MSPDPQASMLKPDSEKFRGKKDVSITKSLKSHITAQIYMFLHYKLQLTP